MKTIETKDCIVKYKDDKATKQAVFDKVVGFFLEHESFSGESIMQADDPRIEAPVLLSAIADDILCFDVTWKDD